MLGDIHARLKAWTGDKYIGLHWQRTTGATGGLGGRNGAIFFSRKTKDPTSVNQQAHSMTSPEDAALGDTALKEIASIGDAFHFPATSAKSVKEIAELVEPSIVVTKINESADETRYRLTLPDQTSAYLTTRIAHPSDGVIYGFKDDWKSQAIEQRPGRNSHLAENKGDVWIDVSRLNPGEGFGAKIYNIAANNAYNNGMVFIGDPDGLSDVAMRRRPEQMLSSALKFGTTDHIAPHPRQVEGDTAINVPPLDWVYGDHVGNIGKLIDLTLQNIDNVGGFYGVTYDKTSGRFVDASGARVERKNLRRLAEAGLGRAAPVGSRTLARYALLSSLVSDQGHREQAGRQPGRLLAELGRQLRDHVSAVDTRNTGLKEIFYSRTQQSNRLVEAYHTLRSADTLSGATNMVRNLLDTHGQFNLWDRTIGTQFNKAKKDVDFKRVFNAVQQQIDDTALYAIKPEYYT